MIEAAWDFVRWLRPSIYVAGTEAKKKLSMTSHACEEKRRFLEKHDRSSIFAPLVRRSKKVPIKYLPATKYWCRKHFSAHIVAFQYGYNTHIGKHDMWQKDIRYNDDDAQGLLIFYHATITF